MLKLESEMVGMVIQFGTKRKSPQAPLHKKGGNHLNSRAI
jgi:hypothetical protein